MWERETSKKPIIGCPWSSAKEQCDIIRKTLCVSCWRSIRILLQHVPIISLTRICCYNDINDPICCRHCGGRAENVSSDYFKVLPFYWYYNVQTSNDLLIKESNALDQNDWQVGTIFFTRIRGTNAINQSINIQLLAFKILSYLCICTYSNHVLTLRVIDLKLLYYIFNARNVI